MGKKKIENEEQPIRKSGFVALVGRSNVGKSTLLNTLVGTKIAATSFRPQMTRHIIHGVMNMPTGQATFVDTPGILKLKKSRLSAKLQHKVEDVLNDIDVLIYVVDPSREIGQEERGIFGMIRHLDIPKILVLNKSDLHRDDRPYTESYEQWSKEFDSTFSLSALRASHIEPLKQKVMELLPEGEPFYLDEQLTNIDNHFWIAELIREKVFSVFEKEIPYSITVEVDNVEEKMVPKSSDKVVDEKKKSSAQRKAAAIAKAKAPKEEMIVIEARILTNLDRFKKVIIGQGGQKIKEIGVMARRELEAALNRRVFLELEVEVDPHWVERI